MERGVGLREQLTLTYPYRSQWEEAQVTQKVASEAQIGDFAWEEIAGSLWWSIERREVEGAARCTLSIIISLPLPPFPPPFNRYQVHKGVKDPHERFLRRNPHVISIKGMVNHPTRTGKDWGASKVTIHNFKNPETHKIQMRDGQFTD